MYFNICREITKSESRHSTLGNSLVCVAITLAFVFWRFEGYVSPHIMSVLTAAAGVVMVFCWISYSFSSGLLDRCGFAVFTALFWNVPTIICFLAGKMTPRTFNSALYLAGEYSKLLVPYSLGGLPILKSMDYVSSATTFSCICLIAYFAGMLSMWLETLEEKDSNNV